MAITIDQFLRDLTEKQVLSGEELSAFRRELAVAAPKSASRSSPTKNGGPVGALTKEAAATDAAALVLCDCLITEKLRAESNHWVFAATRLKDDAPVTIHVLRPEGTTEAGRTQAGRNGTAAKTDAGPAAAMRIASVGRYGEMLCLCSESIEAETLEELVLQHDGLPLELATETLLGIVQTLKEIQSRGLELTSVSADRLLLDEDGRVHLSGRDPAGIDFASGRPANQPAIPSTRLLASLGDLFEFLQTGGKAESAEEPDSFASLRASARVVADRLLMREATLGYKRWDELLRDLETLQNGRELEEASKAERRPDAEIASATPAGQGFWLPIAVAIAAVAALAVWAVLNR